MDPEWKQQNVKPDQPPEAGSQASKKMMPVHPPAGAPQVNPSTIIRPAAPAGTTAASSARRPSASSRPANPNPAPAVQGPSYLEDIYASGGSKPRSKKKLVIAVLAIFVLSFIAASAFYLSRGKSDNAPNSQAASSGSTSAQGSSQGISVPSDWQSIDTGLGFTVKAPNGWSSGAPVQSTFGKFVTDTMSISDPARNTSSPYGNYVSLSTVSLSGSTSQTDFENAITDISNFSDSLSARGIDKSQVKTSSQHTDINGKSWFVVDTQVPGQFSRSMYLWVNDRAVGLTVASDTQSGLTDLINNYLLPMAASLQLQ